MMAKINYNAVGTWLEPHIGLEVSVVSKSKNIIRFWWDLGDKKVIKKYSKTQFTIK